MAQSEGHGGIPSDLRPFADNCIPVIFVDRKQHTEAHPFCWETDCFCHTDADAIARVKEQYDSGLITAEEAKLIMKGKTL